MSELGKLTTEQLLLRALGADDEHDEPALCILHGVEDEANAWAGVLFESPAEIPVSAAVIARVFDSLERRVEAASEMLRRKLSKPEPEASP